MKTTQLILYRWLAVIMIFPVMLRECIDTLTDIGSFQGNIKLIQSIITYNSSAVVKTIFNRTIHIAWLGNVGAVGFIVMHAVFAVLLIMGSIQIIRYRHSASVVFCSQKVIAIIGLCLVIAGYLFFFGVLAMDYFMSQLHGYNYNLPLIATMLPAAIVLFYVLMID